MATNSDTLAYDIEGLKSSVESLKETNQQMVSSQQEFLNYINGPLTTNWNTPNGKIAIEKMRAFAENDYQNYINYLSNKISDFEEVIIPQLINIDNA